MHRCFKGKAWWIQDLFIEEIKNYAAIGAGRDYALAALYLGNSVSMAVEAACELNVYCKRPVKIISI